MEPRPGVRYATRYYKQTPEQRQALEAWLIRIGSEINQVIDQDSDMLEFLVRPLSRFKKSSPGEYYSVLELFTDMLGQLQARKDMPEAMIGRWNRLCQGTPWQIQMTDQVQPTPGWNHLFE
jgi:hypothetical protein